MSFSISLALAPSHIPTLSPQCHQAATPSFGKGKAVIMKY